jgi:hypothetical protein
MPSKIWKIRDIQPGMIVCRNCSNEKYAPDGWYAKWTDIIGWTFNPTDNYKTYCLINIGDGMVGKYYSEQELITFLNENKMIVMPQKWLIKMLNWLKNRQE